MDVQSAPVTAGNPRVSGDIGDGIVTGQEHVVGKPLIHYPVDSSAAGEDSAVSALQ